jgi:hypothetical protein
MQQYTLDAEKVESASKYLVKLLRYGADDFTMNSRGWASIKDVRVALRTEFGYGHKLLSKVLNEDPENRFQTMAHADFSDGMIRATRGHDCEEVDLLEVNPSEEDLSWYRLETDQSTVLIEAVDEDAANRLWQVTLNNRVEGPTTITPYEGCTDPYWDDSPDDTDTLQVDEANYLVYQDVANNPYLSVERRVNMGGDKGRYVRSFPDRMKDRLPPEE